MKDNSKPKLVRNTLMSGRLDPNIFIIIEGIDGTGKTTIAKQLAEEINGQYIKSPPPPFDKIKQHVLETATPMARFTYFLCSNIQLSVLAKTLLSKSHVVADRYVWSTVAYHAAIERLSVRTPIKLIASFRKFLLMPDLVIFLTVQRQVQLTRIKKRSDNSLQRGLLLSNEFQLRLMKAYRDVEELFEVPLLRIDTTNKSISAIIDIIKGALRIRGWFPAKRN